MLDLRITDVTPICAFPHRVNTCDRSASVSSNRKLSGLPPVSVLRGRRLKYRLAARQQYPAGVSCTVRSSASGTNGATAAQQVDVTVERGARNSRRLYAAVQIAAPVDTVWGALTNYQGLGNFIPGLTENRCLSKTPTGAKLLQVGEQDVAFGAKFRARVVLDIEEHSSGIPQRLCSNHSGSDSRRSAADEQLFPLPRDPPGVGACKDVCFSLVEGDFQAFRGIWRMQQGPQGQDTCRLSYALFVRPQVWLPIRLIQNRVENEIKNNLAAVRRHSESLYGRQGTKQGAQQM